MGSVRYHCNNNIHKFKFQLKEKKIHFPLKMPDLGILKKVFLCLKSATPQRHQNEKSSEKNMKP